jgi:SH3 domain-containing YSC84-like protein 1
MDARHVWLRSVLPEVVRVGFVFGGSGGRGLLVGKNEKASWSGPAFYTIGTANVGFQAGVDVSEILVLVMTKEAMESLLTQSVKLGTDASVSAGPVGIGTGTSGANSDFLVYSRSKGVFGGVSLQGANLKPTKDWNKHYYGKVVSPTEILVRGSEHKPGAMLLIAKVWNATSGGK